jgi:serine/tyrosine/threonine adenylyltransferase
MNAANPWVLPRNWVVQEVIEAAERGEGAAVEALLAVLRTPYTEIAGAERLGGRRPDWARNKAGCSALSCSS